MRAPVATKERQYRCYVIMEKPIAPKTADWNAYKQNQLTVKAVKNLPTHYRFYVIRQGWLSERVGGHNSNVPTW
jgi:hypothetical protein